MAAAAEVIHLTIYGVVQGVGFRDAMCWEARRRGVRGWVRNRSDGTVEAVIDGPPAARAAVVAWAHRGPSRARVTRVDVRTASDAEIAGIAAGFARLPTV